MPHSVIELVVWQSSQVSLLLLEFVAWPMVLVEAETYGEMVVVRRRRKQG